MDNMFCRKDNDFCSTSTNLEKKNDKKSEDGKKLGQICGKLREFVYICPRKTCKTRR